MDDVKIITLRKPVTVGSDTIDQIGLREPTGGEMVQFEKELRTEGFQSAMNRLISLVSGVPKVAIERVGIRDLREAADFLSGFTGASPGTGDGSLTL